MTGTRKILLAAALLCSVAGMPALAQVPYNGGKCSGSLAMSAGDSATFVPGGNPSPEALWLLVASGQGPAIMADSGGGQTGADFYLNTGDMLVFPVTVAYTLYFQGGSVQLYVGGTILDRPANPVCSTGSRGPVVFKVDHLLNFMTESGASSPPKIRAFAYLTNTAKTSGNLTYVLASALTPEGSFTAPTCSACCQPDATSWALKPLAGGAFTLWAFDSGGVNFDWNTAVPASLSCDASAAPASGTAPLTVSFTGTATGGSYGYGWKWNFGDGATSTIQNPSHTYKSGGAFTWKFTVTDLSGATCTKTGKIKVTSPLSATAAANPRQGPPPLTVGFTATPKGGTPPYAYAWDFADGSTTNDPAPSHTFTEIGAYEVSVTVSDVKGNSAETFAPVYVGVPIPPTITSVAVMTSPFRLKILGSDFQGGCTVTLDGAAAPQVTLKTSGKLIVGGGASLKAMVPKGVPVCVAVQNTDGGASDCFAFIR